jgi:hypothetical protein
MNATFQFSLFTLGSIDSKFSAYFKQYFHIDVTVASSANKHEQLFVFKENLNYDEPSDFLKYAPAAQAKVGNELPYATIQQTLESNKLLYLPRLSSMQHFLEICQSQQQDSSGSL